MVNGMVYIYIKDWFSSGTFFRLRKIEFEKDGLLLEMEKLLNSLQIFFFIANSG